MNVAGTSQRIGARGLPRDTMISRMSGPNRSLTQATSVGQTVFVFVNQASSMAVINLERTGQFVSPVYAAMAEESFRQAYTSGSADFPS